MIKHFLAVLIVFALVTPAKAAGVNLNRGQGLACEAILCAVGIAIPESHSECRRVLRDWTIYLATLGPFRRKPRCPRVNDVGNVYEEIEMICDTIVDIDMRAECHAATTPPGPVPCDELIDPDMRHRCETECDTRWQDGGGRMICEIR